MKAQMLVMMMIQLKFVNVVFTYFPRLFDFSWGCNKPAKIHCVSSYSSYTIHLGRSICFSFPFVSFLGLFFANQKKPSSARVDAFIKLHVATTITKLITFSFLFFSFSLLLCLPLFEICNLNLPPIVLYQTL